MNIWLLNIAMALSLSVYLAGFVIPKILVIAFRKNLFDIPDERKIHTSLVPRLGGIAFKPVIFFTLALIIGVNISLGNDAFTLSFIEEVKTLSYISCAVMLLYLIGFGDDLVGIRYRVKFVAQFFCAVLLIAGGLCITDFHGLFGMYSISMWVAQPLTVLLVIFIINSINFIDGIDGLASGLSSVILLFYGIVFCIMGEQMYALISFSTLGVLIPFYYYNVFGDASKQKKIFMGDTGSLTIGLILCALSLKLVQCAPESEDSLCNPLILAYSPVMIPCLDVVRVVFGRIRRGKNPFLPDKSHIHHKLLALGMNQHVAMITIITSTILLSLCNVLLSNYINITLTLALDIAIWTGLNVWMTKKIKGSTAEESSAKSYNEKIITIKYEKDKSIMFK